MKIGDLVQIRNNDERELLVILAIGTRSTLGNQRWVEVFSLSASRTWFEMMKDLRAVKKCP